MSAADLFIKRIKLVKYVFLSFALCIIMGVAFNLYLNYEPVEESVDNRAFIKKSKKISKDFSLSIEDSVFEGKSSDLTPYKIFSNLAVRDNEDNYLLDIVNGSYYTKNGKLTIKSKKGEIDKDKKNLILSKDAEIIYQDIVFNSNKIIFNLLTKDAISDCPVTVNFKKSILRSDSLETEKSGYIVKFKGSVDCQINTKDF